ncbi:MAG TPA: hypothetical protein VF885_06070, partial [Arthrobacter sp.]
GELPEAAIEAPKPTSRKAIIIGGVVAAVMIVGGITAVSAANQKPGPEAVTKTYLQALADGKGAEAVKVLDEQSAAGFNDASFKALEGATERIGDIKVGEAAGVKPIIGDSNASIKYSYSINGKTEARDFSLRKNDDGAWVIVDGVGWGKPMPDARQFGSEADFRVKIGNGPEVKNAEGVKLFPGVYPLSYSGNEYLKLEQDSYFEEGGAQIAGPELAVVPVMDKVQTALDAKFAKFVQDCLATGDFAPKLNGESCGINEEPEDMWLNSMDTSRPIRLEMKVTQAPAVTLASEAGTLRAVATFKSGGTLTYFVRGTDDQLHTNGDYGKDIELKGWVKLDGSGVPVFVDMVKVPKAWSEDELRVGALK